MENTLGWEHMWTFERTLKLPTLWRLCRIYPVAIYSSKCICYVSYGIDWFQRTPFSVFHATPMQLHSRLSTCRRDLLRTAWTRSLLMVWRKFFTVEGPLRAFGGTCLCNSISTISKNGPYGFENLINCFSLSFSIAAMLWTLWPALRGIQGINEIWTFGSLSWTMSNLVIVITGT